MVSKHLQASIIAERCSREVLDAANRYWLAVKAEANLRAIQIARLPFFTCRQKQQATPEERLGDKARCGSQPTSSGCTD